MNATEFATIASAIKAAYPSANLMPDKQSKEVWYTMLADLDYKLCLAAVKEHISTNKFPPAIAEIREKCANIVLGETPDWGIGWGKVIKTIGRYGMYQEDEALESMDDITKQCVKRLGWRNICTSENIVADRANFRMIYEQILNRKKTDAQLSIDLKEEKLRIQELVNQAIDGLDQKLIEGSEKGES